MNQLKLAVIVPMANESNEFAPFTGELADVLTGLGYGTVYLVVDKVSTDTTLELCRELSKRDPRFVTIFAPDNRHVVDAYLRGFGEAYRAGFKFIIEMDAGMSHDPKAIPRFLKALEDGYPCVFGSRFIPGGAITDASFRRWLLSRGGTLLANLLLGTRMADMTSGFQGFHADVIAKILKHPLLSTAHFYQTELRYLLRNETYIEVPISYRAPSPRVSRGAVLNALQVLAHYFILRLSRKEARL